MWRERVRRGRPVGCLQGRSRPARGSGSSQQPLDSRKRARRSWNEQDSAWKSRERRGYLCAVCSCGVHCLGLLGKCEWFQEPIKQMCRGWALVQLMTQLLGSCVHFLEETYSCLCPYPCGLSVYRLPGAIGTRFFLNYSAHHRAVVFWDILLKASEENLPTAKNDLSWRAAAFSTGSDCSSVTSQQPSTAVFAFSRLLSEEVATCASLGMAVICMCLSPEDPWSLHTVPMPLDTSGAAV